MPKSAAICEEVKAVLFLPQLKRNKLIFFPISIGMLWETPEITCPNLQAENKLPMDELKYEKHHNCLQKKTMFYFSLHLLLSPTPVFCRKKQQIIAGIFCKNPVHGRKNFMAFISLTKVALAGPHRSRNEERFLFCQREQWAVTVSILPKVPI